MRPSGLTVQMSGTGSAVACAVLGVCAAAAAAAGCRKKADRTRQARASLPTIQVHRKAKLLYTFKDGRSFQTVDGIDKVPAYARGRVKVMDPSVRGVGGEWVYVADLCAPDKKGDYSYKVVRLAAFEDADPAGCGTDTLPSVGSRGSAVAGKVIMYMTTTCPVCRRAEQFLRAKGIPHETRDVGRDPRAAAELREKAARAGISATGVPVFDIGGRVVQGFDPSVIERLASGK